MDSISITELAALIARAAAGEAGKSAWDGLLAVARRAFGRGHATAIDAAKAGDRGAAVEVAGALVQLSTADAELAQTLRQWMAESGENARSGVSNVISGHARVHGNVVQARDIGSVHFGNGDTVR